MGDGVLVHLRLPPKASANRITGIQLDAEGNEILKAQVTTVPEGGKANAALINARWYKMLAREWKLAKSSINLVHGAPATASRSTSRHVMLHGLIRLKSGFPKCRFPAISFVSQVTI